MRERFSNAQQEKLHSCKRGCAVSFWGIGANTPPVQLGAGKKDFSKQK